MKTQCIRCRVSKKVAKCAAIFGILKQGNKMLEQIPPDNSSAGIGFVINALYNNIEYD